MKRKLDRKVLFFSHYPPHQLVVLEQLQVVRRARLHGGVASPDAAHKKARVARGSRGALGSIEVLNACWTFFQAMLARAVA